MNKTLLAMLISSAIGLQGCNSNDTDDTFSAQLRVLETSDIHANVMDYDYYQTKMDITIGLARTASLIKIARSEVDNTLLVDN